LGTGSKQAGKQAVEVERPHTGGGTQENGSKKQVSIAAKPYTYSMIGPLEEIKQQNRRFFISLASIAILATGWSAWTGDDLWRYEVALS
jgi:hypothetical protein